MNTNTNVNARTAKHLRLIAAAAVLYAGFGAVAHAGDADSVYGEEWRAVLQDRPGSYDYADRHMQPHMPVADAKRSSDGQRTCALDSDSPLNPRGGRNSQTGTC